MPISPQNQSKSVTIPRGTRKAGVYLWGDVEATWGDATATWGDFAIAPVNISKSVSATSSIPIGSPIGLLLSLTYADEVIISGGWVNQSKN